MTCDETRATFSDLYDEELSGARLVTITQHLCTCPACQAEWANFRRAMQAVADLGTAEPSSGFAARVRQQLEAPTRWQRILGWLFLPLHVKVPIQAVAVLVVAFAGFLLYQSSPDLRRAVEPSRVPSPPAAREAPTPASPPAAGEPARKDADRGPSAEAPKAEESSRLFHAESAEPGGAPRVLRQAAPAPAEPGGAAAPVPAAPNSLAAPLSAPGPGAAPAPAEETQTSSLQGRPADVLYGTGLTDLADGKYERSIDNLRAFLAQYPQDARVPDARLRLGEAYVGQGRYAEALQEYEAVVQQFPSSPLVPTALYLQAQTRLAQGDRSGCQLLRDVADLYPQAPEAASARQILAARCH